MKNILLIFSFLLLLFSCEIKKQKPLLEQISRENKYLIFDKNELAKADTIEILYVISGASIFVSVRTTLIKNKNNNQYFLSTYYNRDKILTNGKASSDILNDVFAIQEQVVKYPTEENTKVEFEELSILIGKKILYSRKNGHKQDEKWSKYEEFTKKYLTIE